MPGHWVLTLQTQTWPMRTQGHPSPPLPLLVKVRATAGFRNPRVWMKAIVTFRTTVHTKCEKEFSVPWHPKEPTLFLPYPSVWFRAHHSTSMHKDPGLNVMNTKLWGRRRSSEGKWRHKPWGQQPGLKPPARTWSHPLPVSPAAVKLPENPWWHVKTVYKFPSQL